MPVGKKISKEEFNKLPEKRKKVILRNRRNSLQTRKRRQEQIVRWQKHNDILLAEIELKKQQIPVFCNLRNKDIPVYLDEIFHPVIFPLIELRSLENVSDKMLRNRIHAHNNLAKLKNKVHEVEVTNNLLLERNQKLSSILDGLVRG